MKTFFKAAVLALGATLAAGAASASTFWVDHGVTLNARSGPGTHYKVVGTLSSCSKVHVVAHSHGWAKIATNYGHYWVSARYLQNHACGYKKPSHGHNNGYNSHRSY